MRIEYVWIMGLCVIISTIISLLLIRKYIQWLLLYSARVSAALIEYYEATDEEDKYNKFPGELPRGFFLLTFFTFCAIISSPIRKVGELCLNVNTVKKNPTTVRFALIVRKGILIWIWLL